MSRSYWTVYAWSGSAWVADTDIPRPNENLSLEVTSTQQKIRLLDGSNAYQTPEVTYENQPLTFKWTWLDDAFVTQIQDYIINQDSLKIVTHVSGREFFGRFTDVKSEWLQGQTPDTYDIEATFELMPEVSSSSSCSSSSCRSSSSSSSSCRSSSSSSSSRSSSSSSSSCRSSSSSSSSSRSSSSSSSSSSA